MINLSFHDLTFKRERERERERHYDAFRSDISPYQISQGLQSDISLWDYIGIFLLIVFLLGTCMASSGGMSIEISDQIRL